jgi:hypothetical protein
METCLGKRIDNNPVMGDFWPFLVAMDIVTSQTGRLKGCQMQCKNAIEQLNIQIW